MQVDARDLRNDRLGPDDTDRDRVRAPQGERKRERRDQQDARHAFGGPIGDARDAVELLAQDAVDEEEDREGEIEQPPAPVRPRARPVGGLSVLTRSA